MDSQMIQCPVCTLFLHVGMNLQDHLNTHPKDQVISALVNMTLLQQRSNDENSNNFECSRYEPLTAGDDLNATAEKSIPKSLQNSQQSITYFAPISQQTSHQLMIVNGTQVFHDQRHRRIGVTSHQSCSTPISRNDTIPPLSIPARTFRLIPAKGYDGKITQSIPPPPPYHASVRNAIHRNEINQITTQIQQSCSTNVFNVSASSSSTLTNINAINTSSSAVYVNRNAIKQLEKSVGEANESSTEQDQATLNESTNSNENELSCEESGNRDELVDDIEMLSGAAGKSTETPRQRPKPSKEASTTGGTVNSRNVLKQGSSESATRASDTGAGEKKSTGLKVLSNVQVTPNAILNVSLNSTNNESIPLNNMIIVSSIPSTSNGTTSQVLPKQLFKSQSILKSLSDLQALSDGKSPRQSKLNVDVASPDTPNYPDSNEDMNQMDTDDRSPSDECFVKPCSSKATSVIRLASQKSPKPSSSSESVRPANRQSVKKLVVKLKKPFVPVIEEEANLHPPDEHFESRTGNNLFDGISKHENEVLLECSEDVPFSPLRQSYTPLPVNHTNLNDSDELIIPDDCTRNFLNETNPEVHLIDVKLNKHTLLNANNFEEQPENDVNASANKDNLALFQIDEINDDERADTSDETHITTAKPYLEKISTTTTSSECTSYASSSSTLGPNSSQNDFHNVAGTSRMDYGLTTFLDFNEQRVRVRLSPIPFVTDNNTWNPTFNSSYTSNIDEGFKHSNSGDIDGCKNSSVNARAPSTDSLNIRTDEKMPAKGEISEQESNGDVEGLWSHQVYSNENDNLPRYTNSYDTTVARESWSLSNEPNLTHEMENMSTILMKFSSLEQSDRSKDVKPFAGNTILNEKDMMKGKPLAKIRKYRCPICSQIFTTLKEKRAHLIQVHDCQQGVSVTKTAAKAIKFTKMKKPTETITSASCSTTDTIEAPVIECKKERETLRPFTSLNNYLLSYNWSTLKARPTDGTKDENKALFAILDTGVNYVCKVCEEQFNSIRAYDMHMTTHPAECYTCGRTFKRWVNFSIHLKRHLNIREHRCIHCPKRFVLRQSMIEHMRIHSNESPLKCSLCMKRFKRFSNLIQHRNRHHLKMRPQAKDFICSCGEVFHSQAKIAWHRETHDVKPKCCPYCRERFMHKNSLVRHIRLSHTERFHLFKRDSVECPYCKKKYIKSSLKMHMEQHKTSRTTYECTICNKTLTTKWNLKQHKWIHASRSSKPFKCSMCTKAFIRESEYISHMNTHKAIKPYTCDHCGCQFARKYNWLRHTREHETNKKFRCETCGKDFHRAYYLKEHKRIHTGERPFECVICGKTSTTKTNHNKHVKIHHARDPLTAEA